MVPLFRFYFCNDDGFCMVCKQRPPSNDVVSCNSCASLWHIPCLRPSFFVPLEMTTSDVLIPWDCPRCSPVHHPAISVIHHWDNNLTCISCMRLPERPVTTPCGHNLCLKCFQKRIEEGKRNCGNCGSEIPSKMARQPRINTQLASAIRTWKVSGSRVSVYDHYMRNQEEAKRREGRACSGRICVRVSEDHFGPIGAENDPVRNEGVMVGETWENRMGCRQWGVHLPIVAGVAGKSSYGAQSVALSGGCEDDEDHGDWFLYTGSGGTDLGGDTCTGDDKPFDQKFVKLNDALRVSCQEGYPVRVVRSHKEKRSSYAPETGLRYDGIYRIEKCWRKYGIQGYKVCRYLFVRCDNEPAPWTSDEHGDRPRPLPVIEELKNAMDLTERKGAASWDYDERKRCWLWKKPPPHAKKKMNVVNAEDASQLTTFTRGLKVVFLREKLLREYGCNICGKVLDLPLTTPCTHSFCKACLFGAFSENHIMKCPSCSNDISLFLHNPQINREVMNEIESVQRELVELMEESDGEINTIENELEEQSRKRRKEQSAICVLNRQQTMEEFLAQEEEEEDDDDDDLYS